MKNALITGKIHEPSLSAIFKTLQEELYLMNVDSFIFDPAEKKTPKDFDIVFSVGGDGNFVGTARRFVNYHKPIIAVKAGKLGFLQNIDPKDFKNELPKLFDKKRIWTKRILISGKTNNNKSLIALNEFLFSDEQKGSISRFSICINGEKVIQTRGDAILISTPTGSTAYNLAAGGPITLPDMEVLLITPVCSHIVGTHPLVVGLNNSIEIINSSGRLCKIWADGQDFIPFENRESFRITEPLYINGLDTTTRDFFDRLAQKLGWKLENCE